MNKGENEEDLHMRQIREGIYPTMITTFTEDNKVDYAGLEKLLAYYKKSGCDGIFALCLSSEIFHLSDAEMVEMMRFLARNKPEGLSLIASSHTSDDVDHGIRQLAAMAENGAEQPVIILNRLAMENESEDVVKRNAEKLFNTLPDITFGIYECPYPYKRMVSDELLSWFAKSGRIGFLKDTCCNAEKIRRRLEIVKGTGLQLFNANTATLLDSLRAGGSGFSGVMGNFHADLYAALYRFHKANDPRADKLQAFLTIASMIESQLYPTCAKHHLRHLGIPAALTTRNKNIAAWNDNNRCCSDSLAVMEEEVRKLLCI